MDAITNNMIADALDETAAYLAVVEDRLNAFSYRFAHLEGHVAELAKRAPVTVVKGGKFLPFVAGAALGIYVYRNRTKIKALVDNQMNNVPQAGTINDTNVPNTEN